MPIPETSWTIFPVPSENPYSANEPVDVASRIDDDDVDVVGDDLGSSVVGGQPEPVGARLPEGDGWVLGRRVVEHDGSGPGHLAPGERQNTRIRIAVVGDGGVDLGDTHHLDLKIGARVDDRCHVRRFGEHGHRDGRRSGVLAIVGGERQGVLSRRSERRRGGGIASVGEIHRGGTCRAPLDDQRIARRQVVIDDRAGQRERSWHRVDRRGLGQGDLRSLVIADRFRPVLEVGSDVTS